MDEHLSAWSIAWAELRLGGLERMDHLTEPLDAIPEYPLVEMDFSILVPNAARYERLVQQLTAFRHPLLKRMRFIGSYEGEAIESARRSQTFRIVVGDDTRTLVDEDTNTFRRAFEEHVATCGYKMRV